VIDHVGVNVSDIEASKRFYEQALAPLGYAKLMDYSPDAVGFGKEGKPDFWIETRGTPGAVHVAIVSPDRATVDAFHAAAVAAGGKDNGAPGLRPQYHDTYYGGYVLDPDGHNVEAVCHSPE
jgi:catechol 2,3-dioxygenase-like lactoylglutathione lyase family enzyme